MRKCLDCGKELRDVDMVCSECGSENLSLIENEEENYKENKPKGGLIALAVVLIIGIISGVMIYRNSSKTVPAEPVKNAMAAFYSGDLEGYVNEMYGSFHSDAESYLTSTYGSYSSYEESTLATLKETFGDDYSIKCKTIDIYSYSDEMVALFQEACGTIGYDETFEDVKHVTIRTVITNEEGLESYYIADEYSVEINGKWYFLPKSYLVVESEE